MNLASIPLALLLALLAGCSTTQRVGDPASISYEQLSDKARSKKAVLEFSEGYYLVVHDLIISADSASWLQPGVDTRVSTPTANIQSVELRARGISGFLIGSLAGAATGSLIGLSQGSDPKTCNFSSDDCSLFPLTAGAKAALYGVTFGAFGGLIGHIFSRSVDGKIKYVVENERGEAYSRFRTKP